MTKLATQDFLDGWDDGYRFGGEPDGTLRSPSYRLGWLAGANAPRTSATVAQLHALRADALATVSKVVSGA